MITTADQERLREGNFSRLRYCAKWGVGFGEISEYVLR
jgi:hypothetical protein